VDYAVADLSDLSEVRRLVQQIIERFPDLSILVNNAGAIFARRGTTADGFERTLALNVLSPFLLSELLGDRLRANAPSRIINVASEAHQGATMDLSDLQAERSYRGLRQYSRSKLQLLLLTYACARRMDGSGVTVNALHPGFVYTRFGRNNPGPYGWLFTGLEWMVGVSPLRGAETTVYLATAPEIDGVSGKYFINSRPAPSSPASYDVAAGERLWEIVRDLTTPKTG
jgi:NAD(P)-dependent dehydrogenase (short-subunit alcohol dehydrogenase family)